MSFTVKTFLQCLFSRCCAKPRNQKGIPGRTCPNSHVTISVYVFMVSCFQRYCKVKNTDNRADAPPEISRHVYRASFPIPGTHFRRAKYPLSPDSLPENSESHRRSMSTLRPMNSWQVSIQSGSTREHSIPDRTDCLTFHSSGSPTPRE